MKAASCPRASGSPVDAEASTAPEGPPPPPPTDYTLGIYQSIGYREFSSYLSQSPQAGLAPPPPSDQAFQAAVERMKTSTRQYAKRQVSWLRNKLLPAVRAANMNSRREGGGDIVPVYLLDASELGGEWMANVQQVAQDAMEDFLEQRPLPDPRALSSIARDLLSIADKPTDPAAVLHARRKTICPICTCDEEKPVMIEEGEQWVVHIKTRRHRRAAARSQRDSRGESGAVDRAGDTEIAEPSVL